MTDFDLQTEPKKRENVVAGVVGAFLGSLLGVACIVIVGQMGYVASICGLVMAVCSLKGYELLGGALGKKGAAISSVLILVMTYLAHQLDWAISVASALEAGILESFRAIPDLREIGAIEGPSYWGGLVMLYIFTLLGAVPTVMAGLRGGDLPDLPATAAPAVPGEAAIVEDVTVYPGQKGWTRPLRLSASLSMLVGLVPGIALLLVWMGSSGSSGEMPMWVLMASLGCILSAFVMAFRALPLLNLCQAEFQVMARRGGTLWQIQLTPLNRMDTYRFTRKNGNLQSLRWEKLAPEEQERARASIARAIDLLQSGQVMSGSLLSRVVMPLTDLQVEGEDRWRWKTTYSVSNGRRKKLSIAKAYPGFAPVAGMEPSQDPMPWRPGLFALALVVALAGGALFAAAGGGLLDSLEGGSSPARPRERIQAQAPDSTETYTISGVSFQMDAGLETDNGREFSDPGRELRYTVSVQFGQDGETARDALLQPIGDYRMKPDFDSFSFLYAQEDVILPMTALDGSAYQHGVLTVYFTGGEAIHTAVALSEDGVLFTVEARRDQSVKENEVNAALLFILESVRISSEARAMGQVTEETYQSLFHLAEEEGYQTIGVGYIKAPEEMYGYADSYVDAYVPYSDAPEYLDDGYTLRSAAHGMEVVVTIARSDTTAEAVVDGAYETLAASGTELYEEGVYDTQYEADYDIAFKQVLHFPGGEALPRLTILYADHKEGSYYLSAQITYLLEQTDGDYPLLVEELSDVFALTLPELDPLEE